MQTLSLTLILISVALSVAAQILLKQGMSNPHIAQSFEQGIIPGVLSIATNFFVVGGLFAYVASAGVWLSVLAKVDVSKAYPFVGLGFIGTMLCGYWLLNEPLTTGKIAGTCLIVIGIYFISK